MTAQKTGRQVKAGTVEQNENLILLFALSVLYAVLGNVFVYGILIRRKIQVRSLWAGTPGYLYRVCATETAIIGPGLRRFALSTNIAFLVAMVLGVVLGGMQE